MSLDNPRHLKLRIRSELLREIRGFFHERDFLEVQTPVLSRDTMVDQAIDPIPVSLEGVEEVMYLQTSPEFSMKRLLIEGIHPIYEITPVFRSAEKGIRHNPEFTMLEWYRLGDGYFEGIQLLQDLVERVLPGRPPCRRLAYREAFESEFGINPHLAGEAELRMLARKRGLDLPKCSGGADPVLQWLVAESLEPRLGLDSPVILFDWPSSQAALARLRNEADGQEEYQVAERYELYIDGLEIANGYHELCDPQEQRARLEANHRIRLENGRPPLPLESRLLDEMESVGLPACSGVALGIERLLMVLTRSDCLADGMAFDLEQA